MDWWRLFFILVIVVLYIPMVFLGANVFFDKYGPNDYYRFDKDCYRQIGGNEKLNASEQAQIDECLAEQQEASAQYDKERRAYEGQKYVTITIFNLLMIIIALLWTSLNDVAMTGLFLGAVFTTFGATLRYFNSNSKIGFGILVVTFFLVIFGVSKKLTKIFKPHKK